MFNLLITLQNHLVALQTSSKLLQLQSSPLNSIA
jgi:hypothetical protein